MRLGTALFLIFLIAVFGGIQLIREQLTAEPDYEAQANCIAEYDYTHPRQSQMDNLVAALKECR